MQHVLDIVPGRPRLHRDRPRALVQHDPVEAAHVQHDAALAERLAAHAVAHAGRRDRQFVVARKRQRFGDVIDAVHLDHAVDFGPVETARIIDAAAELRPFYARQRRDRLDPLQIDLALLAAVRGGPAILFADGIGRQRLQLAKAVNAEQHHQHRDRRRAGFEFLREFLHQLIPDGVAVPTLRRVGHAAWLRGLNGMAWFMPRGTPAAGSCVRSTARSTKRSARLESRRASRNTTSIAADHAMNLVASSSGKMAAGARW